MEFGDLPQGDQDDSSLITSGKPIIEFFDHLSLAPQLSERDVSLINSSKTAIDKAEPGVLSPEIQEKTKQLLHHLLNELSPNKVSTAQWILDNLQKGDLGEMYNEIYKACTFMKTNKAGRPSGSPSASNTPESGSQRNMQTVGRSSKFSSEVKSVSICRVTGASGALVQSCHILAFSARNQGDRIESYQKLIKAMFGPEALTKLLANVMNDMRPSNHNINRLDNGIPLSPSVHAAWDSTLFYLKVKWETYNQNNGEV